MSIQPLRSSKVYQARDLSYLMYFVHYESLDCLFVVQNSQNSLSKISDASFRMNKHEAELPASSLIDSHWGAGAEQLCLILACIAIAGGKCFRYQDVLAAICLNELRYDGRIRCLVGWLV